MIKKCIEFFEIGFSHQLSLRKLSECVSIAYAVIFKHRKISPGFYFGATGSKDSSVLLFSLIKVSFWSIAIVSLKNKNFLKPPIKCFVRVHTIGFELCKQKTTNIYIWWSIRS